MTVKVNLELSVKCYHKLAKFLEKHEYDIAIDERSYGDLKDLFIAVFDKEPSEDS